jgi:polyvinyl alcohol dehydrogenase (cytochrome)
MIAISAQALDAETGATLWKVRLGDHPAALITGAPTLASGMLVVPAA